MMHKVKMLGTQRGVHDGEIHPATFIEGGEYEIGDGLLESFIELGVVELVGDESRDDRGEKSLGHAPANKMKKATPANK